MTNQQHYARRLHRAGVSVKLALGGVTVWHHRISSSTFGFATFDDRERAIVQAYQHALIFGFDATITRYRDVQSEYALQFIMWREPGMGGYHYEQHGTRIVPSARRTR